MAKRGRPRGLNLNPAAVEDLLDKEGGSKQSLAEAGGITTGHLSDALYRQKGVTAGAVNGMAGFLKCHPATIAPELTRQFASVRPGDDEVAA